MMPIAKAGNGLWGGFISDIVSLPESKKVCFFRRNIKESFIISKSRT